MIKFVAGIIVGVNIVLILLLFYGAYRVAEDKEKEKENELLLLRIKEYQKRFKELESERKETDDKNAEK